MVIALFFENDFFNLVKMDSDSDNESVVQATQTEAPPLTQVKGLSAIPYAWVILFTWDVDKSCPFSIVRLTHFKNSDFPWECITGEMTQQFRSSIRTFSNVPKHRFCIFGKVQQGKILLEVCPNNNFLIRYKLRVAILLF